MAIVTSKKKNGASESAYENYRYNYENYENNMVYLYS